MNLSSLCGMYSGPYMTRPVCCHTALRAVIGEESPSPLLPLFHESWSLEFLGFPGVLAETMFICIEQEWLHSSELQRMNESAESAFTLLACFN